MKYSNLILSNYEFNKQRLKLKSYPSEIYLNTTNLCNYRCSFCEIHYFYEYAKMLSGRVFSNNLTTVFINKFSDLFNRTFFLELSGATGEPFLNPNFNKLIKLLKRRKIELMVTTNGSLIKNNIAETLVDIQFDEILVSLHSGDPNCYTELQGGNYDEVVNNLKYLIKYRNIKGVPKPRVSINCLIFKSNQHTIKDLLKHMKSIDVDRVNLNHYYASRNKIQGDESFYFHPKEGNKFLHELYSYAKLLDLKLTPDKPQYIIENDNKKKVKKKPFYVCDRPWKSLKFKGCVEYENSHYISICNRIILFRLNYKEFEGDFLRDIWNHEILRYFRRTVMNNPICHFCKDLNTPRLRCINNREYQIKRDIAVKAFFDEFYKMNITKEIKGIYEITENPYKYVNYYEK